MYYFCVLGNAASEAVVRHYLGLHKNVASVSESDFVELKIVKPSEAQKSGGQSEVMLNAATSLVLALYRNQLLHVFVRPAIIALSLNRCCHEFLSLGKDAFVITVPCYFTQNMFFIVST